MTGSVTAEFRHEYEAELGQWLRRRFLWYAGVVIAMSLAMFSVTAILLPYASAKGWFDEAAIKQQSVGMWIGLMSTLLYVIAFMRVFRESMARDALIRLVIWLAIINGVLGIASNVITIEVLRFTDADRFAEIADGKLWAFIGGSSLTSIFFTNIFASAFLPWTVRECLRAIGPPLILAALVMIVYGWNDLSVVIGLLFTPLVAVPGTLIAWWRNSRFRQRFHLRKLKGRYGEMKRELVDARRIHEDLFPTCISDGPVRFDYRYEPMRQIGGDYLFARSQDGGDREPVLNLVIIDVTGHGITAALTVNRLHGEIERQFGSNPDLGPGELLRGLNDYLHYSLAAHSVYATAICMRADPNKGEVSWASAGHPPAFLHTIDGRIDRLDSTTIVLGACRGDEFEPLEERRLPFGPGDTVLAYTDGAIEAKDERGQMLRVDGLQRYLATLPPDERGGWCSAVLREVDRYRYGPPDDDTLIVELFRPLDVQAASLGGDGRRVR